MSVAFVTEESAEAASEPVLPARPISDRPNLVTPEGLKMLEGELAAAQRAGLTTGFTSGRSEKVFADVLGAPDVQGSTLVEVVDALLALPPR